MERGHEGKRDRSVKQKRNLSEEITADHIQVVHETNCLHQSMLLSISQQDCNAEVDVRRCAFPATKVDEEKCNILKFMENLKKYFEKRNSLDDYDFIVESIANLSSTGK